MSSTEHAKYRTELEKKDKGEESKKERDRKERRQQEVMQRMQMKRMRTMSCPMPSSIKWEFIVDNDEDNDV